MFELTIANLPFFHDPFKTFSHFDRIQNISLSHPICIFLSYLPSSVQLSPASLSSAVSRPCLFSLQTSRRKLLMLFIQFPSLFISSVVYVHKNPHLYDFRTPPSLKTPTVYVQLYIPIQRCICIHCFLSTSFLHPGDLFK